MTLGRIVQRIGVFAVATLLLAGVGATASYAVDNPAAPAGIAKKKPAVKKSRTKTEGRGQPGDAAIEPTRRPGEPVPGEGY